MGSYTAPSFTMGYHKAVIDNTDALNSVPLGPVVAADFFIYHNITALYDGNVFIQVQLNDDSWSTIISYTRFTQYPLGEHIDVDWSTISGLDLKYPFHIRALVNSAATVGAMTLYFITTPGPGNPLF